MYKVRGLSIKIGLNYLLLASFLFLLFTISSSAINKKNKDYGLTHKTVFNDPENCTLCHIYNNFPISIQTNTTATQIDDEYEDEFEGEASEETGLGWFFGKKKKKEDPYDTINLSLYINQSYEMDGFVNDETIMPHDFIKSITSMCMSEECHTAGELGPSHAVDISPYQRYPDMIVPKEIPLNWDTEKYEEVITCGSCHNPHLDWLSSTPAYESQESIKKIDGTLYYLSYFLRVKDTKRHYYPLCKSCHGIGY
jgi:hypothetical protein